MKALLLVPVILMVSVQCKNFKDIQHKRFRPKIQPTTHESESEDDGPSDERIGADYSTDDLRMTIQIKPG